MTAQTLIPLAIALIVVALWLALAVRLVIADRRMQRIGRRGLR